MPSIITMQKPIMRPWVSAGSAPTAPTVSASRIDDTTIRFTFTGGSGATSWTGYYRTPDGSGSYTSESLSVGQAYSDVTVSSESTADYYVAATNAAGTVNSSMATGSAASGFGTLLYFEDWENATVGQPARTRTWDGVTGGIWNNPDAGSAYDEVSGSIAYAGSRSAFVRYYTDNQGGACQLGFDMGALYREVQISYRWLVPSNYVHKYPGFSQTNNKFFRLWPNSYGDVGKVGASMWRENDARSLLQPDWNSNGDGLGPKDPSYSGFVTSADFGQWVDIEIYCKFESANNANDGVIRIKKNGTTIINATDVGNWYGSEQRGFRYGYLMGAANTGYDAITDFYFDNIEFRVIA